MGFGYDIDTVDLFKRGGHVDLITLNQQESIVSLGDQVDLIT
ncbi:hypothetical protein [Shouchella patagoniensis]|nr:hypothetical protein [Shouchella patagoniensis]